VRRHEDRSRVMVEQEVHSSVVDIALEVRHTLAGVAIVRPENILVEVGSYRSMVE